MARLKLRGMGVEIDTLTAEQEALPQELGGGHVALEQAVRIRAHFERFPASLKGSFVMRGADGNPHQVRLEDARAVELAGHGSVPMGVAPATLDVAPNRDLFVPFEFPVAELSAGVVRDRVRGRDRRAPETVAARTRFAVPWPRARPSRPGPAREDREVGDGKVRLDQLECRSDQVELRYEGTEATDHAGGRRGPLPVLEATFDAETGPGSSPPTRC